VHAVAYESTCKKPKACIWSVSVSQSRNSGLFGAHRRDQPHRPYESEDRPTVRECFHAPTRKLVHLHMFRPADVTVLGNNRSFAVSEGGIYWLRICAECYCAAVQTFRHMSAQLLRWITGNYGKLASLAKSKAQQGRPSHSGSLTTRVRLSHW
jgi:hypothetical protein